MDDIIQKLIEFDRQCVEKVELAKKKKAEAQSSMMSQKSTIYSEYIDSQQDQVEKHKQDLLNKNKEEAQCQYGSPVGPHTRKRAECDRNSLSALKL